MTLEWDLPGLDTPGFLRRRKELLGLLVAEATPDNLDRLAQHLVQYVKGPISHDEALEAIMELPLRDYARIIEELTGG